MVLTGDLSCGCRYIVREVLGLGSSKAMTGSAVQGVLFSHTAAVSTGIAAAAEAEQAILFSSCGLSVWLARTSSFLGNQTSHMGAGVIQREYSKKARPTLSSFLRSNFGSHASVHSVSLVRSEFTEAAQL